MKQLEWLAISLSLAWWAAALLCRASTRDAAFLYLIPLLLCAGLLVRLGRGPRGALALGLNLVAAIWWSTIQPSNERDWQPDVAKPARMSIEGDAVKVHNVRNFHYRGEKEWDPHWETRSYHLSELRGMDLFLSKWGAPGIAHTILSFDFGADRYLSISIETRKEKGEEYSALRGFFRDYELYYVVADERDVIRLRTNFRGEDVSLFRLRTSPLASKNLFLDYARRINRLFEAPVFYNALTDNCTTAINTHIQAAGGEAFFDWRLLANAYADEMLYERRILATDLPLAELQQRSAVSQRARTCPDDGAFSECIRADLPNPRLPESQPLPWNADSRSVPGRDRPDS
jgi:Domain of unknown function (DUF4105)